ncbi:MAG TPA: GtrA family protein [Gemmatimonadales bacterium]|nr:GtrA family protein [Gemmatimonadales bacterium]
MAAQFMGYAAAGAVGTMLHYAILLALVEIARIGAVAASTCGAVAGALVNYALNYRYTFRSRRPHRESLLKFGMVSLVGVALNALVVLLGTAAFGWHYVVAQVVATGVVLIAAFAINRAWTF